MMPMFKNPPRVSIHGSRSKYGPHLRRTTLTPFLCHSSPTRPRSAVPTFRTQIWTRSGEENYVD